MIVGAGSGCRSVWSKAKRPPWLVQVSGRGCRCLCVGHTAESFFLYGPTTNRLIVFLFSLVSRTSFVFGVIAQHLPHCSTQKIILPRSKYSQKKAKTNARGLDGIIRLYEGSPAVACGRDYAKATTRARGAQSSLSNRRAASSSSSVQEPAVLHSTIFLLCSQGLAACACMQRLRLRAC